MFVEKWPINHSFNCKLRNKSKLACVASVSVGFSARSRHFSLFGGAKKLGRAQILARSKSEKCFKPVENPTETLATQAKGKRIMF